MLTALVSFSIRFRGVILALAAVLLVYGGVVVTRARLDVFPEFAPPMVVVPTEAPGLSPEEVEQLVTRPIEASVAGSGDLDSIRSQSIQGLSVVTAIFRDGTDIFRARQLVSERLAEAAREMPQGIGAPVLAPLTSATSMMLAVGLTSEKRTAMQLRTLADWTLRPRLLAVPGVAKVAVFGGEVRQLQVQVRPERLLAHGLSIEDVVAAARSATGIRGAGFVETPAQRVVLRTEGQSMTPGALGEAAVVHRDGNTLRLRDVARVVDGPRPRLGEASVMGRRGVILLLSSQYGANTLEVTRAAERALEEMRPAIESANVELHPRLFRPATFIETAVGNLRSSLLVGAALVAAILVLFLGNVRTAAISMTAIPLSLLAAVVVLDRLGATINTLTLGGLAIAIGEVVDDAIIDVENVFRRLRENRSAAAQRPALDVVLEASLEVRSAVVYATFVVALVFLPVVAMSGVQGRLFAPLGLAYVFATMASLVVALTVTPALAAFLLTGDAGETGEPRVVAHLKSRYREILGALEHRPGLVVGLAAALSLAAVLTLPFFGGSFLPELREGHFIVHMAAVPGTSADESLRVGRQVSAALLRVPHVRSVGQRVGRAELSDDIWGPHYSELDVDLEPVGGEETEAAQESVRAALASFPGLTFAIKPFLTERIEEVISGVTAEVVIRIFGEDLNVLDLMARDVASVVSKIDGARDVQVESPPGIPEIVARLRAERLRQLGLAAVPVLEAVQTAYQGATVGETHEGNRVFDVAVVLDPDARRDPEAMGALVVAGPGGLRVPLRQIADLEATSGRYAVLHDGMRRRQSVTLNVRGRDLASFVAEVRRRIAAEVRFPPGVYASVGGAIEAASAARRELLATSLVAAAGVLLLLAVAFGNLRNLLLVVANLPFALVGGVLAVFLTGGWLSVGSLVGFVTLFGISTRNSIMMISHFDHLVVVEGMDWGPEAALRGATERLAPVVMTALVTALGLLPIALGSGEAGREIEGPMAIVILGGLLTSTALNLLVLPTLALRYGRFGKQIGRRSPSE